MRNRHGEAGKQFRRQRRRHSQVPYCVVVTRKRQRLLTGEESLYYLAILDQAVVSLMVRCLVRQGLEVEPETAGDQVQPDPALIEKPQRGGHLGSRVRVHVHRLDRDERAKGLRALDDDLGDEPKDRRGRYPYRSGSLRSPLHRSSARSPRCPGDISRGRSNRLLTGREHLQTDVSEPSCRRNRRAIGPRDRVPLTHQYPLASRCLPDTRSDSNRRIVDVDVYAQSVPGVPQRGRRHDGAAAVSRVRRHVRRPHGRSERVRVDRPLGVLGRGDLHRAQGDRAKRMIPR